MYIKIGIVGLVLRKKQRCRGSLNPYYASKVRSDKLTGEVAIGAHATAADNFELAIQEISECIISANSALDRRVD